jgi:hypothetical protein
MYDRRKSTSRNGYYRLVGQGATRPPGSDRNEELILRAIIIARDHLIAQGVPKNTGIEMCRAAQCALGRFEYESNEIPVFVRAQNPIMAAIESAKTLPKPTARHPLEQVTGMAFELGIGDPDDENMPDFNGHLVLKTASGWLLDASLDLASRPHHGLVTSNWYLPSPLEFPEHRHAFALQHEDGGRVIYTLKTDDPLKHLEANAWKSITQESVTVDFLVNVALANGAVAKSRHQRREGGNSKRRKGRS